MEDSAMDEAAMPDATMMDTGMDATLDANLDTNIDDLFGEAADGLATDGLGVPLTSPPLPPELVLHIANMHARGCCTNLAWSSTGSIAQIKDDGQKVGFRTLIRNSQTGTWSLTEDSNHPLIPSDGARWEHIQFSNIGVDLAVADSLGRVFIHTLTGALGKMPLAHTNVPRKEPPRSDMDAVVGLHWIPVFPTEFRFPNISQATKDGERWSTSMRQRDPSEPHMHHPVDSKQALLYVSRDAKLTLMYQNDSVSSVWHATETRLGDVNSSVDLVSHAAMCEEDDHILLVTHDLSKRFRLYKVNIRWNATPNPRQGGQGPSTVVSPTFDVGHLTTVDHAIPQHADAAELSLLRIVGAIPSNANDAAIPTLPTILAVFTRASLPIDVTQQSQEAYSVISRWHVESAIPTLHEAFTKLKVKGASATPQHAVTDLKRQEDIFTNKLILSFESQCFNTILAFAASDGTIEFRDRITMASIEPYPDPTTVASLPQSGFEYVTDSHCVDAAMSGDGGSLVTVLPEGNLSHRMMSLRYTWHPIMDDGGLLEAAVVCLARQYTILCCTNVSNGEVLALLPPDLSSEMRLLFVKEVIKMLQRNVLDISMQDAQRQQVMAFREPLLPKAMSAQYIVGRIPGTSDLAHTGKFAWAFLNMRLAATSLAPLFARSDLLRADVLVSLRGLVKWGSDILVYVADNMIANKRMWEADPKEPIGTICERFVTEKNCPVIYMLLCTFTRIFLRFLALSIPKYLNGVQRLMAATRSTTEYQQLMEIWDSASSLPFKYTDCEAFITDIDTAIRTAYTRGAVTAGRRLEIELSAICCDLPIPDELQPAIKDLFDVALPKLMDKVDLVKLYFWDTSWLGIEPVRDARQYDAIRKVPLTRGMKLKVCRRCGALMEDLSMEKARDLAPTLIHVGRHCVCSDYWTFE